MYNDKFDEKSFTTAKHNIDYIGSLQTKSGKKSERLKTLDESLQSLRVIPETITVKTIQDKINDLDGWRKTEFNDNLLIDIKESTNFQQGGKITSKKQDIKRIKNTLKKRSLRKNKQNKKPIRMSKSKKVNKRSETRKVVKNLLKKRSLRKNKQNKKPIRMSKKVQKRSYKKKISKKVNKRSETRKAVKNLLRKRSLRKNKQNKKPIDLESMSS